MKKFWITLLSILILVTGVAFVAACDSCGSDESVLSQYILDVSLVDDDFNLPRQIGGKEVKWESDSDAIKVESIDDDSENYLANVTLGDSQTTVKLTVSVGKESKSFDVTVKALDVHYFAKKYTFKQNNSTVFKDFDLDTEYSIGDKTATISWAIEKEEHKEYIALNEAKNKCIVTQSTINPQVRLIATFKYNELTHNVPYRFTVSFERGHLEEVDYWYNNTGVSIEMSGYVVAIATAYSESYENVTLYMIDDDFCAGYYLYRVKASAADGAKLAPGVHVTVTGTTNTNYNGLIETNAGGTLVVDDKTPLTAEELALKVYALDNDLLSGAPAAVYNESRLVSLNKWTVDSVEKNAPDEGVTATLFTLKKGGVSVTVAVSKYMEGVYACKPSDATWSALAGLQGSIKKGNVVSVTGILGCYKGVYQIVPLSADAVKVAEEGVTATEVPSYAADVKKAVEAVAEAIPTYIIAEDKSLNVPTSEGSVEIKYELLRDSKYVVLSDGKIDVTADKEDIAGVKVTYTVKNGENVEYSTVTFHFIHSKKMTPAQIVDDVHFNMDLANTKTAADDIDFNKDEILAPILAQYPSASVNWSIKDGQNVTGVKIENNVLVVTPDTKADRTVVVVATVTCGDADPLTKEFTIQIEKVTPVETGSFKMSLFQANLKKTLYFTGELSGNFGATTEDASQAAEVVVAEATDGYTLKVGAKYIELETYTNSKGGTSVKLALVDAATGVWVYNSELNVFTYAINNDTYYLGTYNTYNTISASATKYISGENAANVGVSQFPISFVKPGSGSTTPSTPEIPATPTNPTPSTPNADGSVTANVAIASYATANGWVNSTQYTTINADSNITITASGTNTNINPNTGEPYASNTGKYYTKNNSWRIYQNETPSITVTATTGYKVVSVKITYDIDKTGILTNADKTVQYTSGSIISVDATTITFSVGNTGTVTNGNVQITAIEVIYVAV